MRIFLIILSFILLFYKTTSYIVIPFKTFKNAETQASLNLAKDFLNKNLNNTIYIEIEAGNPTQKIPALILSEEFGFFILNHKCLISSSFDKIEKTSFFLKSENFKDNMTFRNDIFKFPTESSTLKQASLNFMYSKNMNKNSINFDNEQKQKYYCAGVGIRGAQYFGKNKEYNLVKQLFNKNVIKNNYFSIIYSSNSNDEGTFLIGIEPHNHDKKNFCGQQLTYITNEEKNNFIYWSLLPNKIFFTLNNKIYNLTNNINCILDYNLGIIFGSDNYLKIIREQYFNNLSLELKCHEEIIHSVYNVFYCDNIKDVEKFPSLNFYLEQKLYTFTLDYKDLFYEKNGKYFFKIIFDRNNKNQWKLGKPFLKKYIFVFDYSTKMIGFYNENLPKSNRIKKISYILMYILVILTISFFCYIGFYHGKKVYNKAINEKEEEYDYKYKSREERTQANSYIEMMMESKVLDE